MPLSNLNAEQLQSATAPFGHNLIIASAGTGKTSTIVGRIAHLFNQNINPEEILLLTFTNKAASEMVSRVAKNFGEKMAKGIQAGTFHSIAYKYLQKYQISLKQPRELKILFRSIAEKHLPHTYLENPPYSAQYLYDLYSLYLNVQKNQSFSEWLIEKNASQEPYACLYEDIFGEFNDLKKSHHYADFNDLLLYFKEDILKTPQNYAEILCDEYQDTNSLQDSILDALNPKSLFCVGDYDQSIYAFNGADIKIIANFTNKYPNARVFTLSKNYRSSAYILELANRVIEKNERIYPKSLEVVKTGKADLPKLLIYEELFAQYQGIAARISAGGTNYEDIAIIFRNNASADGCEASLRELGIPSRRKGGSSFFDSKEIALLLDICAFTHNPRDMMAFIHILSHIPKIGSSAAKEIYDDFENLGDGDIHKGILQPDKNIALKKKKSVGLFDFGNKDSSYHSLKPGFDTHPILSHSKIDQESALFLQDFYFLYLSLQKEYKPNGILDAIAQSDFYTRIKQNLIHQRIKNKDGSLNLAIKDQVSERIHRKITLLKNLGFHYQNLGKFLNAMILGSSEVEQGNGVNLLSIHASKGLEFKEVYVIDLMDGRFPNNKLIQKGGSLEEERRLFYVAVTRAKETLFLSYAKKDALKNLEYKPSIFLYESNLLQKNS